MKNNNRKMKKKNNFGLRRVGIYTNLYEVSGGWFVHMWALESSVQKYAFTCVLNSHHL